ncbi:MAG: hypothetical protein JXB47_10335 [Anaerolineae bacterium]|nr:hypothetical protein [Anaerolineae bacterium]
MDDRAASAPAKTYRVLGLALVLAILFASRMLRTPTWEMNSDETWMVWQTFGAPAEIIRWSPPEWPPLNMLLLGAWGALAGIHPFVMRYSSILVFLLGAAFSYRAAHTLAYSPLSPALSLTRGERGPEAEPRVFPSPLVAAKRGPGVRGNRAALLAMLAYSALGFAIFKSMLVRSYVIAIALLPLVFWLAMRYFARPTLRRAAPLGLAMLFMFHIHLTSAFGFALIGLYTLAVYRRAVWRWWLPGLIAVVPALPLIVDKLGTTNSAAIKARANPLAPFPAAMLDLFEKYAGYLFVGWAALFILAAALLWLRARPRYLELLALLAWMFVAPALIYVFNDQLGFFAPRYTWWAMLAIALWLGWGLAYLPRAGALTAAALFVVAAFWSIPIDQYSFQRLIPIEQNLAWLAKHIRAGDVILIDPNCKASGACRAGYEWNYFAQAYFPNGGLEFVDSPEGHRRIWYVKQNGAHDRALEARIWEDHVPRTFFGPPDFLFRLQEAPPDIEGILFENGLRFHGADILDRSAPAVWREGETIHLQLWWSVDAPPSDDYSIGFYLIGRDGLVAQTDGPPQTINPNPIGAEIIPKETSRWEPGRFYIEERTLAVPYPTFEATFALYMAVYRWWDGVRIAAPGVDADIKLKLFDIPVKAW